MTQEIQKLKELRTQFLSNKKPYSKSLNEIKREASTKRTKYRSWTFDEIAENLIRTNPPKLKEFTYSFIDKAEDLSNYISEKLENFFAFDEVKKNQFRGLFKHISSLCNLKFREVKSGGDFKIFQSQLAPGKVGSGRPLLSKWKGKTHPYHLDAINFNPANAPIDMNQDTLEHYKKIMLENDFSYTDKYEGFIWINSMSVFSGEFNSDMLSVILHEIAHAIGFSHSGPFHGKPSEHVKSCHSQSVFLGDNSLSNIMTYGKYFGCPAVTMMAGCIRALEKLFGEKKTNPEDNIYTFENIPDRTTSCVKDNGGNDTFDFSDLDYSCRINLIPGAYSCIGNKYVANSCGTVIENVITGYCKSRVNGNEANNIFMSNGEDTFLFSGENLWGHDVIHNAYETSKLRFRSINLSRLKLVKSKDDVTSAKIIDLDNPNRSITLVDYYKKKDQFILPAEIKKQLPKRSPGFKTQFFNEMNVTKREFQNMIEDFREDLASLAS